MPDGGRAACCFAWRAPISVMLRWSIRPIFSTMSSTEPSRVAGGVRHPSAVSHESGKGGDAPRPGAGHFPAAERTTGDCRPVLCRLCRPRTRRWEPEAVPRAAKHPMTDIFITENFLLQNDRAVSSTMSTPATAHHRLSLPSAARAGGRGPAFREPDADLALRGPLQMAGDAGGRRAGALLHGRGHGLGEVREVGRDCPARRSATRCITGRTWN